MSKGFNKLFLSDEIFNTAMFGEVRFSSAGDGDARIDTKIDGVYYSAFIKDDYTIKDVILAIDNLFTRRATDENIHGERL